MIELREHQGEAVHKGIAELDRAEASLIVMPTASGKSYVGVAIAWEVVRRGGRVLILVHRKEFLRQWGEACTEYGLSWGIEQAEQRCHKDTLHGRVDVVIGSKDTLQKKRLERWNPNTFSLIIVDEAHHGSSKSWVNVMGHFHSARRLGLTATPERSDEESIQPIFGNVAYELPFWEAVDRKIIAAPLFFRPNTSIDLSALSSNKGDLNQGDLEDMIGKHINELVNLALPYFDDRPIMTFTPRVHSATAMADGFRNHKTQPITSASVSGASEDRDLVVQQFRDAKFRNLCSCDLLREGTDFPDVGNGAIARPTKSGLVYRQMIGRLLRKKPNNWACIAEGSMVLTDVGHVPIEQVTLSMKVWDGIEFVSHSGAVCRGEKETIDYAGLRATPDHEVWTQEGWRPFGKCQRTNTPICVTGIGGKTIRETDRCFRRDFQEGKTSESLSACRVPMWTRVREILHQRHQEQSRMSAVRSSETSSPVALSQSTGSTVAMHRFQESGVPELRWPRDRVSIHESPGDGSLGSGESWTREASGIRSHRQQWSLRARESSIRDEKTESEQHPSAAKDSGDALVSSGPSRDQILGCEPQGSVLARTDLEADSGSPLSMQKRKTRVWDIFNAGPRHRFTVEGLLVSNCIVDYACNKGMHDLFEPINLFDASGMDLDILKIAGRLINEGKHQDPREALKEAEHVHRQQVELRVRTQERTPSYKMLAYDPFQIGSLLGIPNRQRENQRAATASTKARLGAYKLSPKGISEAQAKKLLQELDHRRKEHLATHRQIALLVDKGVPAEFARAMPFDAAQQDLTIILGDRKRA